MNCARSSSLLLLAALTAPACAPRSAPPRDLVLVSFDTVRRDHLSTYGYARPTARTLDRLAATSLVFDDAFTHATNTAPSHLTLFTGVLADRHHVWTNGMKFRAGLPTLASLLRERGFRTAAFVSGFTLKKAARLDAGFETYDDDFPHGRRDGAITVERALAWLRAPNPRARRLLFVHLYDAHGPYPTRRKPARRFRSAEPGPPLAPIPAYQQQKLADGTPATARNLYVDRYDDGIRYEDELLARLLAGLDLERTALLVFADHGETLDERYWKLDHGGSVYDEELRIPLVLHAPGLAPRRVPGLVTLADMLPTLLDLTLGDEAPRLESLEGMSVLPALRAGKPLPRSEVVAHAQVHPERLVPFGADFDPERAILGLRTGRWKLMLFPGRQRDVVQLFDLEADPGELHDVAAENAALRDRMLAHLGRRLDPRQAHQAPRMRAEEAEQLRSLGYVGH